jgi:GNAT superfamily N-acetyltransferase
MEIHIRRGRRTDYEALAALCAWPSEGDRPHAARRRFRRTISDLGYDLYVAEARGEPVGIVAVSYVRNLALGGLRATLEELRVRADRRGAGIGRRLLTFAIERARRRGALRFEARPEDEGAERFLDRFGLARTGGRHGRELSPASGDPA